MSEENRRGNLQYNYINTAKVNGKEEFIGKTIASIDACSWDVLSTIRKLLRNSSTMLELNPCVEDDDGFCYLKDSARKYLIRDEFSGWSKVNTTEGDQYNVETGKDLAKQRCLDKYHKQYNKRLCMFLSEIRFMLATIEHYLDKHSIEYSSVESVDSMKATKFSTNK